MVCLHVYEYKHFIASTNTNMNTLLHAVHLWPDGDICWGG